MINKILNNKIESIFKRRKAAQEIGLFKEK